jgi:ABC-type nitrate/sulfonate/bicarbonate transport system permease component
MDTSLVFACLASITLFTTTAIAGVAALERNFLRWRPSRRNK